MQLYSPQALFEEEYVITLRKHCRGGGGVVFQSRTVHGTKDLWKRTVNKQNGPRRYGKKKITEVPVQTQRLQTIIFINMEIIIFITPGTGEQNESLRY